jgi:hypothetical protein
MMFWRKFMGLFGKGRTSIEVRAITPLNVEPATVPDLQKEFELDVGRHMLQHYVTAAERTVAASQENFATLAARELIRR